MDTNNYNRLILVNLPNPSALPTMG